MYVKFTPQGKSENMIEFINKYFANSDSDEASSGEENTSENENSSNIENHMEEVSECYLQFLLNYIVILAPIFI